MSKLRNDKAELEDRIRDLESRISEQDQCMRELERRQAVERQRADGEEARNRTFNPVVIPVVVAEDGQAVRVAFRAAPKVYNYPFQETFCIFTC